jgi:ArsR family transcriptional regulator
MDTACQRAPMGTPLPDVRARAIAAALKALADPNRVKMLHRIASAAPDGVCVCDLTAPLGISQPSVSYHLRILRDAGLVNRRRDGAFAYYSLAADAADGLGALVGIREVVAAW